VEFGRMDRERIKQQQLVRRQNQKRLQIFTDSGVGRASVCVWACFFVRAQ
jgi:hypothetical protein